jgi:uncharacterized repeat protein (TIGR01451 family)
MGDEARQLPAGLAQDRRQFLTRLLGAAWVAPFVASFSLDGLLIEPAHAQGANLLCANMPALECSGPDSNVANVQITISVTPKSAAAGDTLTYTVTAVNCGPCDATNVQFSQNLRGLLFVSATQTSGPAFSLSTPPVGKSGYVVGTIGALGSGAVATFEVKGTVR